MKKKQQENIDVKEFMFGKVPPNAKDIEVAILGTMILHTDSIKSVLEILEVNDFYSDENKIIAEAIFKISESTNPDYLLISQYLTERGEIEKVGGVYTLVKLTNGITSAINIKQYCLIVKQASIKRRLIDFSSHILNSVHQDGEDIFDMMIDAENKLKGINSDLYGIQSTSLGKIAMNVINAFDDSVYKAKNDIVDENAVHTQFKTWDEINGSLFPGLYVIAGRPGMGKGVHMTECICRMAKVYNIGVINGEMTDEQLLKRIGCNLMGIDNFLFKKNPKFVTEEEQNLLYDAMNEALSLKLHIENSRNIHKIANKIKLWVDNHKVKCVFADFLTLFKVPPELERYYTKTQQVDYILDVFTQLCKDLKIPIVLYVQMNREILGRHGIKEPNMADLKQSGSIEELAYQVSFLHRPEYYDDKSVVDENGEDIKGLMYQIIAKHRDGQLGRIKYKAKLQCSQIKEWDEVPGLPFNTTSDMPF